MSLQKTRKGHRKPQEKGPCEHKSFTRSVHHLNHTIVNACMRLKWQKDSFNGLLPKDKPHCDEYNYMLSAVKACVSVCVGGGGGSDHSCVS